VKPGLRRPGFFFIHFNVHRKLKGYSDVSEVSDFFYQISSVNDLPSIRSGNTLFIHEVFSRTPLELSRIFLDFSTSILCQP